MDGVRVVEHDGGTNGQTSTLKLVPERNFAVILLTNADRGGTFCTEVTNWVFERVLGLKQTEPTERERQSNWPSMLAAARRGLATVELRMNDSRLLAAAIFKGGFPTKDSPPWPAPPPTRVAFFAEDAIVALDPPWTGGRAEFLREPNGRIAWLRWGGRLAART